MTPTILKSFKKLVILLLIVALWLILALSGEFVAGRDSWMKRGMRLTLFIASTIALLNASVRIVGKFFPLTMCHQCVEG